MSWLLSLDLPLLFTVGVKLRFFAAVPRWKIDWGILRSVLDFAVEPALILELSDPRLEFY
jgi:hypothetical protein